MNMNLFNHNNNSEMIMCSSIVVAAEYLGNLNQHLKLSSRQSEKAEWNKSMKTYKNKAYVMRN